MVAVERHKMYRKSVTAANQMLAKRRGRPPKSREPLMRLDQQYGEEEAMLCDDFFGSGADDIDHVCFLNFFFFFDFNLHYILVFVLGRAL